MWIALIGRRPRSTRSRTRLRASTRRGRRSLSRSSTASTSRRGQRFAARSTPSAAVAGARVPLPGCSRRTPRTNHGSWNGSFSSPGTNIIDSMDDGPSATRSYGSAREPWSPRVRSRGCPTFCRRRDRFRNTPEWLVASSVGVSGALVVNDHGRASPLARAASKRYPGAHRFGAFERLFAPHPSQIEQQQLGVLAARKLQATLDRDSQPVASLHRDGAPVSRDIDRSARQLEPRDPTVRQVVLHRLAGRYERCIEVHVLVDCHRAVACVMRPHEAQPVLAIRGRELLLLVARREPEGARLNPDLEKV